MPARFQPKLITVLRDGYSRRQFLGDLGAGLVVGVVALPLAIAFAIASGVTPEKGLYTAIIAGFLISAPRRLAGADRRTHRRLRGHRRRDRAAARHRRAHHRDAHGRPHPHRARPGPPRRRHQVHPVSRRHRLHRRDRGDHLLGPGQGPARASRSPRSRRSSSKWVAYARAIGHRNLHAVAISAASLLVLVLWPRLARRVPGAVRRAGACDRRRARWPGLPVETIGSGSGELRLLPAAAVASRRSTRPPWSAWSGPAITIALLGAIESLLSAVVADGMIGGRHRSNIELIAQGVANVVTPLFRRHSRHRRHRAHRHQHQERRAHPGRGHRPRGDAAG